MTRISRKIWKGCDLGLRKILWHNHLSGDQWPISKRNLISQLRDLVESNYLPRMSAEIICTQFEVTQQSIKLIMSAALFDQVEAMPNNKFTASNGTEIRCHPRFGPGWGDGLLALNGQARGQLFLIENLREPERMEAALTELAKGAQLDSSWTVIGSISERPGLAFTRVTSSKPCYRLLIPEAIYDWAESIGTFKASNGIKIECRHYCTSGFENGEKDTLYLNSTFRGKEISLGSKFDNLNTFGTREGEIMVALNQLEEKFRNTSPPPPPIKLHISEPAYRLAGEDGFNASNGISISCHHRYAPGFGNGKVNCLYLNDGYKGKEVEITRPNFANYSGFVRSQSEIMSALAELEAKVKEPPPKETVLEQLKKELEKEGLPTDDAIIKRAMMTLMKDFK